MNQPEKSLILLSKKLSNLLGIEDDFGNASLKIANSMLIKTSGSNLSNLTEKDIVNSMEDINYVFISDYVAQKYSNEISKLENELNWRKIGYIPKSYNYSSVIMLKRAFSE